MCKGSRRQGWHTPKVTGDAWTDNTQRLLGTWMLLHLQIIPGHFCVIHTHSHADTAWNIKVPDQLDHRKCSDAMEMVSCQVPSTYWANERQRLPHVQCPKSIRQNRN